MLRVQERKSQAGLKGNKIDWEACENIICVQLAQYGLHGQTIANHTGLTRAQVYNRLQKVGIKLRDYRDGETQPARIVIEQYSIQSINTKTMNQLRKQTITPINF